MEFNLFNYEKVISLLQTKLSVWYEASIKNIPNIFVAIIVLFFFFYLGGILRKAVNKVLLRISYKKSVNELLSSVVNIVVILIGVFSALEIIGLEKTVTSILAGAGVIGIALGFAFQEIAANFVAGLLIAYREPYQLGDIIEIDNIVGQVTNVEFRITSITTFQGLEVFIPNKDMFTKPFINYTSTPRRRVDLTVGVSYSADLDTVERVTKDALSSVPGRIDDIPVEVYFEEFGDSSINLSARVWVHYNNGTAFFQARHEAIKRIKKSYDENEITIPFPIRTLEFGNSLEMKKS